MQTVHIKTARPYDVLIGRGLLDGCGKRFFEMFGSSRAAIVTDDTVDALYAEIVEKSLDAAGISHIKYVFSHGEASKNTTELIKIVEFLAQNRFTRTDYVIALGGGVTGDMAGFAASVFLRGIRFVQIPTTFLSAIDSSVGGKTAVNLTAGKNLCGTFWQPSLVLCDCDTLKTLPEEYFKDGVSEALKYGGAFDEELFEEIRAGALFGDKLLSVVKACVQIKNEVVSEDELDTGRRQLLNFGHTLGHAIERLSNYEILHGHAVAIGMVMISRASAARGICDETTAARIRDAVEACGLPTECEFSVSDMLSVVANDKKRAGDSLTLVVPERIGKCSLLTMSISDATEFLSKAK